MLDLCRASLKTTLCDVGSLLKDLTYYYNTHNLDFILQLKYMPIVMNQPESPRVAANPRNAMVSDTPYLQNEFGDPRFFTFFI